MPMNLQKNNSTTNYDNEFGVESTKHLRAILYLDDTSRLKIKTNVSEIGLYGISFINNFSELTKELIAETKTLIILEGYFNKANSVSDLILYKELFDLDIFCLGNVEQFKGRLNGIATLYSCDITFLDFDLVQSAVYGDTTLAKAPEELQIDVTQTTNRDLAKRILKDTVNYNAGLRSLANEYLSLKDTLDLTITDRDRYKELYEVSDAKNLKLEKENSKFVEGYADIVQKVFKLNTSLKTYESVLSADVYEKVDLTKYTNRPLIIYFKEFEDLIYLDTFIETLYYVFTNQYHKSVKVVRLYDSAKTRKLSTLPNYYYRLYNKFTSEEAIVHNFICKTADYRKLFDVLLTNNSNLDVLLVFDHKDLNDLIFSGSYLQFNLCRTLKHLESYNIKKENTIVNFAGDEEKGISWDYYSELKTEEMKDRERRFLFLSSRPVITRIYALSKFFAESI